MWCEQTALGAVFRGPRSDIIRDGPSGTMKLRYVAINTRGVDSNATARGVVRAAHEADVAIFTNELQRIANAQQEPDQAGGADVFGLTAPKRFAFKSLTAYQRLCMQDDSVPGYKSEAGCEIECVSDVFEVEVNNNVFEISILPGNESDPLQGAYVETPDRFIRDTPVVSYNPTVVNCIFAPPAAPAGKKHHHRRRQLLRAAIADVFDDLYRYHHVKFTLTVAGIAHTDVGDADKAKLKELIAANPIIQGAVSDISDEHVLLLDVRDAGSGNSNYDIAVYSTASDDDVAAATAMGTAFDTVIGNATHLTALKNGLDSVSGSTITGVTDTRGIGMATLTYAASDGIPFVEGVDINGARDLVPTCGSFVSLMNVGITSLDGNGVYGKLLDIDLLHFPPTLNFELAKRKRSCPSRDNPHCYFNLNTGKMHWDKATNALVGDDTILDGTTHQFTVFCANDDEPDCGPVAIFRQPVAGSKATGSQEVQTMFMPGNPGEYTFIFGQSGTYSKPVTVVVENRLTGIEIVSEPTAAQLEVKFAPGQVFPTPVLKLTGPDSANPQPIPSYSVSARFVDDSGNTAPVLLDVGRENFDNVMGTSRTAVSNANGNTQWFGAKAIDAVDGCYRMQFMYAACGGERDGPHPSACPTVEDLQPSGYFGGVDASPNILDPVLSVPTTAKWCFSNKGTQYAMKGVMSSTTTPGVNLPSTPVMRLSLPYKNSFIADEGLVVGFLMPYSIKRNSALMTSTNITAVKSASNALLSSAAAGDAAASSDAALDIADELFSETPDEIIPPIDRFYYAKNTLSGNLCIWGGGRPVYGRCKKNLVMSEVSPETSQADPATGEVVREYAVEAHFDQFQWNRGVNGELMQLIPARPVNFYFHQNDAAIAPMEDSEPSAKIQLRLEAATIAITLQPRQIVEVGGLFEVRVKVTIASGAPLPFVNVMANITVGKGSLTETAAGFMDRIFGAQNASAFSSGLMPELDSTRVYARTNRAGVARFKLKTALGRPGYYALYFSTGKVRSAKSASFQLINPVNKVEVKTYAPNSVIVDSKTGFPAELPAPGGKVSIKVTDITGAGITPTQEAIIFHTQVVEVFPGFEKQDQSDNVKELMNGKSEGGTKELQAVYSVVVEGAKRLKPRAVATKKANFIYDGEPTHVGDGVYEFANPRLVATAKGNFRVQFIVQGIAASVTSANATGHDQAVNVYSKAQADRIKWLNTIAVFALITFMFAGTFPHTRFPRLSLVLVTVFSIVGVAVVPVVSATQSPVWWITLYGSIACVILLSLISLLCTLVNHPATHSFAQRREASMFAYCRRLFSDPESAQAGSADENNKIGYHLKASLKDIASSAVSGISKDAFFYPTKVVAAFLVANAVVIVLMVNFIATAINVSEATRELARKTVNTIFTYTTQLEEAYYSQQFAEIASIDEEWAYTQARSAGGIFSAFGDAYQTSALIGVSLGFIVFVVSWVVFIATYRMTMLRMRRGIYEWDRTRVDIRKASEYTGVHVSTSLITFALFSSIITVVCVPFSSPVLFRVMWSIVKEYWPLILSVVVPMIINIVVLLLFKKWMIEKTHINRRWAWALWEVWDLMAQLLVGLAKGLARWIVAVVVAFFAIARTDKDALPAWVIGVTGPMLDPVASRVKAMMQMNHMHNAPVFRVAAWIIQRGADDFAQRDKEEGEEKSESASESAPGAAGAAAAVDGFISAKGSRVRNRFQVAFLIHKNPKLAEFRGAALQAACEEKEEALAESKWKMFAMCMPKKKKKNEDDADVEKLEVEDIERVESGKK